MSRRLGVAWVLSAALLAAIAAEIVATSRNTLLNHPAWANGKLLVSHPLMGSTLGAGTRNLLARNRLALHEWFGFNELLLDRAFALGSVELRFRLADGSYLAVLFDETSDSFRGVRFSRREDHPGLAFRADRGGRFLEKHALGELGVAPGWHAAALRARGDGVSIELDGRVVGVLPIETASEQTIGFRGGHGAVWVDDVVVRDAAGEVVIDEGFRNEARLWPLRATLFAAALALLAGIALLGRGRSGGERQPLFGLVLAATAIALPLGSYLAFDFFYWSSRYPYEGFTPWRHGHGLNAVERVRRAAFEPFSRFDARDGRGVRLTPETLETAYPDLRRHLAVAESIHGYPVQVFRSGADAPVELLDRSTRALHAHLRRARLEESYTVLLLGSSQAFGAGASRPEASLAGRLHGALQRISPRPVALVNGAASGSDAAWLRRDVALHLAPIEPDLVVIDLSNNDEVDEFAEGLNGLVESSRKLGADVLLVLEANSLESPSEALGAKHGIMREVGVDFGLPVVDLHGAIAQHERADAGFLWWDRVHLTDFGQALAAEVIAAGILDAHGPALRGTESPRIASPKRGG